MPTFLMSLIGDGRAALGPLWTAYIVLVHATAYGLGVAALLPFVPRARPGLRASLHAALLAGTLLVSVLCFLPLGWWAWLLPEPVAMPLFWLGTTGVAANEAGALPGAHSTAVTLAALVLVVWVAGAVVFLIRLALGWATMSALTRRAVVAPDPSWSPLLRELCVMMDTGQVVSLRLSASIATPVVWGVLEPTILLPAAAAEWPASQRRMVLLHELAHVRRGDILLASLAAFARAWYWFHPAVRLSASALREAREEACDQAVLATGVRRSDYAACLLVMADAARELLCLDGSVTPRGARAALRSGMPLALPMAATRGIDQRIRRLLATSAVQGPTAPRSGATCALLVTCVVWAAVVGTVRLAPQRALAVAALSSPDPAARGYAALLLGRTRRPGEQRLLRERAERDPSPMVRRIAGTRPALHR